MSDPDNIRSLSDQILEKYLTTPFWENDAEEASILSPDCILEFPYAPPGMPKVFDRGKRPILKNWLRRTIKDWSRSEVITYPTVDPTRYWVESRTKATVTWGGSFARPFDCTHMELVVIVEGRIVTVKTWSDPLAYYNAAGITIAPFYRSTKTIQGTHMPDVPLKNPPKNEEEAAAKRKELFDYYLSPDFFDDDRDTPAVAHLFDPEFRLRMPFMPLGLPREFDDNDKATMGQWVKDTLLEWHENEDVMQDKFLDPDLTIVESSGSYGMVKWDPTGATSGYFNDYVMLIKIKNFRLVEFREYLDPILHNIPAGALMPVLPFFY